MRILDRAERPFRYFLADRCLRPELEAALLDWFENSAPWRLVETDFYEQYEFSMLDVTLPEAASSLVDSSNLTQYRMLLEAEFDTMLGQRVDVVAHKLLSGQKIAIHNDYLGGAESHRLTIQLNRGLTDDDGGYFMLFNSFDAEDVHRVLRPVSGSAIGFEIGPNSHHAVSRMHSGYRFTLVMSFYAGS